MWLSCVILVLSVAASIAHELPWYQTALVYQIYPLSFKDSNGDGYGDLKGITESCGYLKDIGVDAVWLSPFYKSPLADFGYDISNHTDVDPVFGTMADFDRLRVELTNIGVKLLIDFDPNHTSDQHPWFLSSRDPSHPQHNIYRNYYVWRDPLRWDNDSSPVPPNNWMSVFGGSAWRWGEERQQFYLHQCRPTQPDLNYRHSAVLDNMTAILEFWLNKGVDGCRVGAIKHVFEDENFPDEPPVPGTAGATYKTLQHIYSQNQPETFLLMEYWRNIMANKSTQDGRQRALFFEVYEDMNTVMKFYGSSGSNLSAPLNPFLLPLSQSSPSTSYKALIDSWVTKMPSTAAATWVIGNHDYPRASGRYGPEAVDGLNLLTGVLPGVMVVYYGEEIGMEDISVAEDEVMDKSIFNRDRERSPMQWDDSLNAGFSNYSSTWLPVNPNYWWLNVGAQRSAPSSHLKVFQEMVKARKDPVLKRGALTVLTPDNDTLIVIRNMTGAMYTFLFNIGKESRTYTSLNMFKTLNLDVDMSVVTGSINYEYGLRSSFEEGSIKLTLRPKAAVLLTSLPASSVPSKHQPLLLTVSLVISFVILLLAC